MRFHKMFSRFVGGGGTVLGSDSAPTGAPNSTHEDNQMATRLLVQSPINRVVVARAYVGAGSPGALNGTLYQYEDLTGLWFAVGAAVSMELNQLSYFDVASAAPPVEQGSAGSLEVALVVAAAGGDPNGEYIFSMAPVLN